MPIIPPSMEAQTRPPKYAVGTKSLRQREAKPAVNAKVEKTDAKPARCCAPRIAPFFPSPVFKPA